MQKTLSEMTIAEIEDAIRLKKDLLLQYPTLVKRREEILDEIKEIDAQIALIQPSSPSAPPRKSTPPPARLSQKSRGKRQKGVAAAILQVISAKPMGIADIVSALENIGVTISRESLSIRLAALAKTGRIGKAGRGIYCQVQNPEDREKPIKDQILEFIRGADDLLEKGEILDAFPNESASYISNALDMLERSGDVVRTKGKLGLGVPF